MSERAGSSTEAESYIARWHARGHGWVGHSQARELHYLVSEGVRPEHLAAKLKMARGTVRSAVKRCGPGPAMEGTSSLFKRLVASGEVWKAIDWDRNVAESSPAISTSESSAGDQDEEQRCAGLTWFCDNDESLHDDSSDDDGRNDDTWTDDIFVEVRAPWRAAYEQGGAKSVQEFLAATAPPLICRVEEIMSGGVETVSNVKELGGWSRSSQKSFALRVGLSEMEGMVLAAYAEQLAADDAVQPDVLRVLYEWGEEKQQVRAWIKDDGKPELVDAVARGFARAGITERGRLVRLGWTGEEWLVNIVSMLLPDRELSFLVHHICEKILREYCTVSTGPETARIPSPLNAQVLERQGMMKVNAA
ncbi:uncharacterized protein SCHCODRAFT_02597871 [Schizophyllum commune H4-8]|uniref:Uncharacterized protein n=1 Tax=Schizophyllum commune (strain H4-8 / FGSC 9210) TaxID=578458 RepID=D8PXW2_SCHCM|nr:uncharacterized protein SCHCODRAFT_02597871 [Schizophyllum commune H4-8]KAI5897075.1 hypothetical protein SCHCODRAFT_02597871 [Schizophyllum commune H4-8]